MGQTIKGEQIAYVLCEKVADSGEINALLWGGQRVKIVSYVLERKGGKAIQDICAIAQLKKFLVARVKITNKNLRECEHLEWVQPPADKTHAQS